MGSTAETQQNEPPAPKEHIDEREDIVLDDDDVNDDPAKWQSPFDAKAVVDKLWDNRRGDPREIKALLRKYLWQNNKLRQKNTSLRLRAVTSEDDIVLKGDDAKTYKSLAEFRMKPSEIKAALDERNTLKQQQKDRDHEKLMSDVADMMQFSGRGKRAFVKVAKQTGIDIDVRDVTVTGTDGKKSKVQKAFAKLHDEPADKYRPLEEYIEDDLGELSPAFYAADETAPREAVPRDTQTRNGSPMVTQGRTTPRSAVNDVRAVTTQTLDRKYAPKK